jgi:uncharacterized protein (TIGR03437 family)
MPLTATRSASFLLALSIAAAWPAAAQTPTWDTSGNGMLKGSYYFRQVYYQIGYNDGSLSDAATVYGTFAFDGNGGFSSTGLGVTVLEAGSYPTTQLFKGTYSIAASGYGFMSNPITGDTIYGMVNQQGIFIGGDTESLTGFNDLFIAVPVGSPAPTAASLKGNYTLAYMDLSSGSPQYTLNAMVQMSPNGVNNLGTVSLTGYVGGNGSTKYPQTLTGTYGASNGAMVLTFPASNTNFLTGQYYLYISQDGNFVFGGSPGSFDMFVGVRTGTGTPSLGGLYYQAGIDQDESQLLTSGYALLDNYYGALSASSGSIIGHQRILELLSYGGSYDYTYADSYALNSNGTYSTPSTNYVVGGDGIRIGSGIGPTLGISVALPAPTLSPTGVYLSPQGIVNAASSAPFTARIAPGEFLTLYGNNLASSGQVAPQLPFPTTLNNVQVMVNGVAAPIYYVSPTQVSILVPYGITGTIAQFQVSNNQALSNIVTMAIGTTAPGVFTDNTGLGYGKIEHQDGSLVTSQSPAQIGETISVYLAGLGAVTPTVGDGAAAPSDSLVKTTNTITADITGTTATVTFAGLAPGFAGLYQVNVTIPSGLTAGDNYLDIAGPDAYTSEALIPIAGASAGASDSPVRAAAIKGSGNVKHPRQLKGRVIR